MSTGLWILLAILLVQALLLMVAIGGNADLCRQNRRLRREAARLRAQAAQRPVDRAGLYTSTCVCSHTIGVHGDLGCDGDPACTCARGPIAAVLDADLLMMPAGVA